MTSTLPAERFPDRPDSAGNTEAGGERRGELLVATLPVPVEWMRYCLTCESEQRFVAGWEFDSYGLVGFCSGCGEERIAPFTRTIGEAA